MGSRSQPWSHTSVPLVDERVAKHLTAISTYERKVKERNGEVAHVASHQELMGNALSALHARKSQVLTDDLSLYKERNPRLGEVRLQAFSHNSRYLLDDDVEVEEGSDGEADAAGSKQGLGVNRQHSSEDGVAAHVHWALGGYQSEPGGDTLSDSTAAIGAPLRVAMGQQAVSASSSTSPRGAATSSSPGGTSPLRQRLKGTSSSQLLSSPGVHRLSAGGLASGTSTSSSLPSISISRKLVQSSKGLLNAKVSSETAAMLRSPSFSMGTRKPKPQEGEGKAAALLSRAASFRPTALQPGDSGADMGGAEDLSSPSEAMIARVLSLPSLAISPRRVLGMAASGDSMARSPTHSTEPSPSLMMGPGLRARIALPTLSLSPMRPEVVQGEALSPSSYGPGNRS